MQITEYLTREFHIDQQDVQRIKQSQTSHSVLDAIEDFRDMLD